jgi:hypothetical protein
VNVGIVCITTSKIIYTGGNISVNFTVMCITWSKVIDTGRKSV